MTGGQSNVDVHQTIPNARRLKNMGVEIFIVAVGNLGTRAIKEMANIASPPAEKHIFRRMTTCI